MGKLTKMGRLQSGLYSLTVVNKCGTDSDDIYVAMLDELELPTIITPNGDDKNDFLAFDHLLKISPALKIYNRWGKLIFQSDDYKSNWPNESIKDGVYLYEAQFDNCFTKKSWVSVVR